MTTTDAAPAGTEHAPRHARPPGTGLRAALRRTVREYREDGLTDLAAALTYYGILAVFPALLALVSVVGLLGSRATQPLLDNVARLAPGPARDILTSAIANLQQAKGTAGVLLLVGLAAALWSASGYVGAFMRASNTIYDVREGRPVWKTLPIRVLTTALLLVMLALVAVGVTLTGGLARAAGDLVGVGSAAVTAWDVAKWPVIVMVVLAMFGILSWAAPNVRKPLHWVSAGAVLAVLVWVAASVGFAWYVAKFGSYNKTYGALGGVIVFLVWLWVSNVALLLGVELDAELERGRRIEDGMPPQEEPFLPPRDTRTLEG